MSKSNDHGAGGADGSAVTVPSVEIQPSAYVKLWAYVNACPGELSGFGLVDFVGGRLLIRDVFVPSQRSSAASSVITEADLTRFLGEMLDSGADTGRLHLYWHSHADFEVFWSAVDLQTVASSFPQADWLLALVLNRRGDVKACLQMYRPVTGRFEDLPVTLHVDPDLRAQIREEIRDKVRSLGHRAPVAETEKGQWGPVAAVPVEISDGGAPDGKTAARRQPSSIAPGNLGDSA